MKKAFFDGALILVGAGMSILFVSTDGNGQNPIPVTGTMMVVVLVAGLVSFSLARFVRSIVIEIVASIVVTDLLFALVVIWPIAFSPTTDKYAMEMGPLIPIIFVVSTAPAVVLSSIGFGRLASRFYQRRTPPIEKGK
jgi:hypothetical protein